MVLSGFKNVIVQAMTQEHNNKPLAPLVNYNLDEMINSVTIIDLATEDYE